MVQFQRLARERCQTLLDHWKSWLRKVDADEIYLQRRPGPRCLPTELKNLGRTIQTSLGEFLLLELGDAPPNDQSWSIPVFVDSTLKPD
jgi:hypothetical protein